MLSSSLTISLVLHTSSANSWDDHNSWLVKFPSSTAPRFLDAIFVYVNWWWCAVVTESFRNASSIWFYLRCSLSSVIGFSKLIYSEREAVHFCELSIPRNKRTTGFANVEYSTVNDCWVAVKTIGKKYMRCRVVEIRCVKATYTSTETNMTIWNLWVSWISFHVDGAVVEV